MLELFDLLIIISTLFTNAICIYNWFSKIINDDSGIKKDENHRISSKDKKKELKKRKPPDKTVERQPVKDKNPPIRNSGVCQNKMEALTKYQNQNENYTKRCQQTENFFDIKV